MAFTKQETQVLKTPSTTSRRRVRALALGAISLIGLALSGVGHAAAPAGRYTVASGTVLDNKTGLVWQRDVDPNRVFTIDEATTYCAGISLSGKWRVPSMKELSTLIDDSRTFPAWDTSVFPDTGFYYFQSSTENFAGPWYVFFAAGTTGTDRAASMVRCVR